MAQTARDNPETLYHDAEAAGSRLPDLLLEANHLAMTVLAGVHGRRRPGMGETFWQFRPFVDGDIRTQIDWRQSARSANRLYIREQEWEVAATGWIWRDPGQSLDYASLPELPSKKYRAEVLATALCSLLARGGERIGYAGSARRPFRGRKAAELFAGEVSSQPFSEERLPPLISANGEKKYVLFSDFYLDPPTLEKRLKAITSGKTEACLVQIVDPSEEDYPFEGRTEFLSHDQKQDALLFGDAAAIAREYSRLYRAHREWLKDICRHHGWSFLVHRTDHPPETALIALYRALVQEVLI